MGHFTDLLFEGLVEGDTINREYSTHDTIDWGRLDLEVRKKFGSLEPGDGASYITPDGTFINEFGLVHADLSRWAAQRGLIQVPEELLDDANWEEYLDFLHTLANDSQEGFVFVGEPLYYMRCNNNKYQSYVILPDVLNRAQIYSLELWFEHLYNLPNSIRPAYIELCSYDGHRSTEYDLEDYTPEELIKRVKRYYSSGKLYEDLI
jgi:hypothetical protein